MYSKKVTRRVSRLLAATGEDALPDASLTWADECEADHCAALQIDDATVLQLDFADAGERDTLEAITVQ